MTDPLSSIASVLAIAGCALESTKFLFAFFHRYSQVSAEVRESLLILEALHCNLTSLKQCSSSLDPRYEFPLWFPQRLVDFQNHLQKWEGKIRKIDAKMSWKAQNRPMQQIWNGKVKRSWEKFKWLTVGDQDITKFMETVKLYQSEFSLEISILLL